MSKKDEQQKKKNNGNSQKKLDISAVAVIDNIVFSKSDAWAYYKITNRAYEFLTTEGKVSLLTQLTNAFNTLMQDKQDSLQMHMIVTNVPVDVDVWREQVYSISEDWNRAQGFNQYMSEMVDFLNDESYTQKVVYLGVHLGRRGALDMGGLNVFESGLKGALETGKEWLDRALKIPTEDITSTEEKQFKSKEEEINRILSVGHLRTNRTNAEELLLLIKRQMYPSMPAPYLDVDHGTRLGAGDLDLECTSIIHNKYRYLKINQMVDEEEMDGYRATLSMSKFPKEMDFPNGAHPFLYFIEKIGLPFTSFARLELHPSSKMKSELEKKKKEQRDELENLSVGMDNLDATISGTPDDVADALSSSQLLSSMLNEDKTAWLSGSYFIVVETPTEELLRKYISVVKQRFTDLGININWTAGDQADLFLAQMPGDKHRMKTFDQLTNLAKLPATGANFSSEVGDPLIANDLEAII